MRPVIPNAGRAGTCLFAAVLAGCALGSSAPPTATLDPFVTATPTSTAPARTATVEPIPTVGPTATPLIHRVVQNDTLLAIASRYGITLDDLLAANPGLNPRLLRIGHELLIPGPGGEPIEELAARTEPAPLELSATRCFPESTGFTTCLLTVRNPDSEPVEGIVVTVTLVDGQGRSLASAPAAGPAGVLPGGGTLPFSARFDPGVSRDAAQGAAEVASAYLAPESRDRLLAAEVRETRHEPAPGRLIWELAGSVVLAPGAEDLQARVTLVATGYDSRGMPVGYAVWKREGLAAGGSAEFRITVFSLGPPFAFVDVQALAERTP